MSLTLAPKYFAPVPDDDVFFTVEINRAACLTGRAIQPALEQTFTRLETEGLHLTISGIYINAASLFKIPGSPSSYEHLQQVASVLQEWTISAQKEPLTGNNRLICVPPLNDRNQNTGTELLGVGIGLGVAIHVYGVPLDQWNVTTGNARFDYTAVLPLANASVSIEVRARLDRNNWSAAVREATDKLAQQTRDFTIAAAILAAPRSRMPLRALRTKDILIMDPVSNAPLQPASQRLRNIIGHYIPFFERQEALNADNFTRRFAARLRQLAQADEPTFQHYLCNGDAALQYDKWGLDKPWRTFFRYDGQRFCGTAMYGYALPMEIAGHKPMPGQGAFYFGLWEPIIEALRDGRVEELIDMKVTPGNTQHGQSVFVLAEDGIAMVWTALESDLKPGMFDGLFPDLENNDEQDNVSTHDDSSIRSSIDETVCAAVTHASRK